VLLSQDEARFPLVPTLGVKGFRPLVGPWDNKDLVYCFAALNLVSGQLTTRLVDSPARGPRRRQARARPAAYEASVRRTPARYRPGLPGRAVSRGDHGDRQGPWHRGALITETLRAYPHLRLDPLPSYSPHLNVIERLWRVLRHRATHNRLFETRAALRAALRARL
jgi:hypothetical protein